MTMEKIRNFKLEFVHYMPKELNQGVLYISMEYSLVIHLCACGCGEKVATPLSPEDWKLYYDGEAITSLHQLVIGIFLVCLTTG